MTDSILINAVLDQSGSMGGSLADATIEGFNAFLEEQKAVPGNAYLTLTLFDTGVIRRFEGGSLSLVPPLARTGANPYQPSGGTALYDAVADSIDFVEDWVRDNQFKGLVVTAIVTDGQENSSQHTTLDQLNDAIRAKKEIGWQFVFMGSGAAAWTEAKKLAIDPKLVLSHAANAMSTYGAYSGLSSSLTQTRTAAPGGQTFAGAFSSTTAHLQAEPVAATAFAVAEEKAKTTPKPRKR